jgi:hypothetical protein
MSELHDYFVASVGAASALTGLLFVAITLAPEKIFGAEADAAKRGDATGAFIALVNVFFVSLAGLIPGPTGQAVMTAIVAALSLYRTVLESVRMAQRFPERRGFHRFGLIGCVIYALEFILAVRFGMRGSAELGIAYTVVGLYSYALGASWRLLGAHDRTA